MASTLCDVKAAASESRYYNIRLVGPLVRVGIKTQAPGLRILPILGVAMIAGAAVVSFLHLDRLPVSLCMFKNLTGYPCMTCGATRTVAHLAALHVGDAFRTNPLGTVVVGLLFVASIVDLALLARGRALTLGFAPGEARWWGLGLGVLALANWAYLIAAGI
jgi:hypothetical protein